jgi:type VI secretion system protein ImpF
MPRTDNELRITPSVLDRLLDYEPEVSSEAIASRSKSLEQLKRSVRRDLEWLLNARQLVGGVPEGLAEARASVLAYGLPDFTNLSIESPADQDRLRRAIELAIGAFEPRLEGVTVSVMPLNRMERMMRFQIEARLKVEPAPEPVTFDTALKLDRNAFLVREE